MTREYGLSRAAGATSTRSRKRSRQVCGYDGFIEHVSISRGGVLVT